jgi:hypothetical protein
MSALEEMLAFQMRALNLPDPVREHRFHKTRRWRWDFSWPHKKIAVEVQGGVWAKGGHTTGVGITRDLEKKDAAMADGWIIYECGADLIKSGKAVQTIEIIHDLYDKSLYNAHPK